MAPESVTRPQLTLKRQKDAMRDGKILGLECAECHERHFTPTVRCTKGHAALQEKEFQTTGKVLTYTIQVVAPDNFINEVPFAWAIIELDGGGPRVSGWIPYVSKAGDLSTGQRVKFTPSYKPGMMFEKAE